MTKSEARTTNCHWSFFIGHWSLVIFFLCALSGREKKCIAGFQPAKVVLTQKELSRLRCRRDAGATIFSHDLCLRGETGRLAAPESLSESQSRRHGENRSRRSRTANIFHLQFSMRRPVLKGRKVSVYI